VEFVRVRDHVGWFPLHPRDRHIPWWQRRDHQHVTYVNRTYVTVINHNHFVSARPVHRHIVRDSWIVQEARSARFTPDSLPIPNRSSLRVVSENGGRRGHRPSADILNRAAVVRAAPPARPPTFQEKLPHIQKSQGKPIEPSAAVALASQDRAKAHRARIRPAAEQSRGDFAPRNRGANSGPAPQPLTEARGKNMAGRDGTNNASERADRAQKTPAQPEPSKGTASRPESLRRDQDREPPREATQAPERQRAQQQELERKKQSQENERKARLQKRQQERERQQPLQERQSQEQKQRDLERRQAQQKEKERNAQLQQNRQEQERREQLRQQQRQQELERRAQEQERKARTQQRQEPARREQLGQQQLQERQAREQQRQQDLARRQQQQQREQERNVQLQQRQEQVRAQQLRHQQAQEQRQAQPAQRQQEQERGPRLRQQPRQERPLQQIPRQPGQL
jgi:hypothetical protein